MIKKISVNITIPVYNEEIELESHISKLVDFCKKKLGNYTVAIIIADNASTDHTPVIGKKLAQNYAIVQYQRFSQKGRGRAVKAIWLSSEADICCYMDVDLSTDLDHLLPLLNALSKGYDIGIGSRLLKSSRVINRTLKREFISRGYNIIIKLLFHTKFSDAQCGFKAARRNVVQAIMPIVTDTGWFMDSELLIIAEKAGFSIYEEPVVWTDNPGSTVRVLPTAMADLKGLFRLMKTKPWKAVR